jgi:hypothetical protein
MAPDELDALVQDTGWRMSDVLDRDEGIYIAILERA